MKNRLNQPIEQLDRLLQYYKPSERVYSHTEQNIQMIIEKATKRELVQSIVHPTTRFVYGSELPDYGDGSIRPKGCQINEAATFQRFSHYRSSCVARHMVFSSSFPRKPTQRV